ncbi:NAD(P)H-dependent flavin oxidoreductase [Camelimonas abortus]|uniref:NAD(P)H-dependent flavin oxidoreductase n=1 Tax=Camelimonas abortus TaxID=1017184 RepID=A0ABV7LBC3_9HYPH
MLDPAIRGRLAVPVIAAPMLRVSGPDLVVAACRAGVVGSFPTANARSAEQLDAWLKEIAARVREGDGPYAPWCPNLIIRQPRLQEDLACLTRNRVEMVITSVGSPAAVVKPLHDVGALVLADVATLKHAEKALEAGADGLVLLTAGAGGQTGWMNGFAFVRAVRAMFDGPLVLAGGVTDGAALLAAETLGCDLAYMGTRFIGTRESMADDAYRQMLVDSDMDDVVLTKAFTGLPTSMLRPSIIAAGLDPDRLDEQVTPQTAREMFGGGAPAPGPRRWVDIRSAGHSVSGVTKVQSVAELVAELAGQYEEAKGRMRAALRA